MTQLEHLYYMYFDCILLQLNVRGMDDNKCTIVLNTLFNVTL